MNKCLVTKLQGTVNNPDLLTLNECSIEFEVTKPTYLKLEPSITYKVDDVAYNTNNVIPAGKHLLKISPKQSLSILYSAKDGLVMDLSTFKGTGNMPKLNNILNAEDSSYSRLASFKGALSDLSPFDLVEIHLDNCDITGSLKDVEKFDKLKILEIAGTKVNCYDLTPVLTNKNLLKIRLVAGSNPLNIEPLAALTNLTELVCNYGNFTGSVENIAQGMINNGRTSGTLKLSANYSSITYQGVDSSHGKKTYTITFSESSYTVV